MRLYRSFGRISDRYSHPTNRCKSSKSDSFISAACSPPSFLNIVTCGAEFLKENGYQANVNTTKAVRPDGSWCSPLPHKTVATQAGLGWIGKSCLLVTKEYGSAVRLSSLLTDAPLPADTPVRESQCGGCTVCVRSCPAGALTGALWTLGMKREELLRKEDCKKTQIWRMKQATGIETDLCGLCFAVCPYTQRYLKEEGSHAKEYSDSGD